MKTNVSVYDFRDAFQRMDRMAGWSYNGLGALYDYLEDLGEGCGQEIELDVIALCCDFSEYESAWDAMYEYQPDDMPTIDADDAEGMDLPELQEAMEEKALEWLRDQTTVIEFDGGVIVGAF